MAEEPRLRVVPEESEAATPEAAEPKRRERGLLIALAIALAATLVLLGWSRNQMGAEIAGLEAQIVEQKAAVAERDRVIAAHERRLGDVRDRIDELADLVERPVAPAPRR